MKTLFKVFRQKSIILIPIISLSIILIIYLVCGYPDFKEAKEIRNDTFVFLDKVETIVLKDTALNNQFNSIATELRDEVKKVGLSGSKDNIKVLYIFYERSVYLSFYKTEIKDAEGQEDERIKNAHKKSFKDDFQNFFDTKIISYMNKADNPRLFYLTKNI